MLDAMNHGFAAALLACGFFTGIGATALADDSPPANLLIYNPGKLKPVDSKLKVKVGDLAPDFKLRAVNGGEISLKQFREKKNIVISFVPAAFTPVCSAQWPGYNLVQDLFQKHNAVLLGITTDNLPSLYAWTREMGDIRFDVLSDFYPHGAVAGAYGVLRRDGTAERALFVIDKQGVIRYIDVHDINQRPPLEDLAAALDKLPN
jgi:peroxiredoxin (alkyl hydroperoxide reductase subunit C)